MQATLFHTSHSHVDRFDRIRDRIAPDAVLNHHVREDWLARAQNGISADLQAEICEEIGQATDPAMCTCTTIGPVAETVGAIRVDRPMMSRAAEIGGPILFVYCLESTLGPSLDLLKQAFAPNTPDVTMLDLGQVWPLFECGRSDAFERAIADHVEDALQQQQVKCTVLAQASMSGATALIRSPTPVLSSPEQALRDLFRR